MLNANRKEERNQKTLFLRNFMIFFLQSFLNALSEPSLQENPTIMPLISNQTLSQSFRSHFAWTRSKMKQFVNSYRKTSIKVLSDLPIHPKPLPSSLFLRKMENSAPYRTIVTLTPKLYVMDIHSLALTNTWTIFLYVDANPIYPSLLLAHAKYFKFVKKMISLSSPTNVISSLQ